MWMTASRVKSAPIIKGPKGRPTEDYDWNEAYDKAEKEAERKMMAAAQKRVCQMRRLAVQRDGHFYALTKQWLRGPIQPIVHQPDPKRIAGVMQDFPGSPPWDARAFHKRCAREYKPRKWQGHPPSFPEFKRAC